MKTLDIKDFKQSLLEFGEDLESMSSIEETCRVDVNEEVGLPPVAISMGEYETYVKGGMKTVPIPICTYGNFTFIQGPPKTMKTFFASLVTSVYMDGGNKFGYTMKGHRQGRDIVHFDTEQGRFHTQSIFRRPLRMTSSEYEDIYHTFELRPIGYRDRVMFIDYYLKKLSETKEIGLVIIDGLADLVSDVNNLEEANDCVQKLMEWTYKYDCHIMTVIHSNFGSTKPTGHLGSLMEKKAETQITLEANTVNEGHITVECKRSRNKQFDKFSFKVNEIGLPEVLETNMDYFNTKNKL